MKMHRFALPGLGFLVLWMLLHRGSELAAAVPPDGWYDYSAYTDCRGQPEPALYNGGILKFGNSDDSDGYRMTETGVFSPAFVVYNLNKTTMYTFSCWVKLEGAYSALITATFTEAGSLSVPEAMPRWSRGDGFCSTGESRPESWPGSPQDEDADNADGDGEAPGLPQAGPTSYASSRPVGGPASYPSSRPVGGPASYPSSRPPGGPDSYPRGP